MTKPLYHLDSYLQEFDALRSFTNPETRAVVIDQTAFYPGGGGQPCDLGFLTDGKVSWPVQKVRKGDQGLEHILDGTDPLPEVGSHLHGKIDWERRYRLMRTHTALHILCGTVFRDFGALVTGGDMDLTQGRMDFEFESMSKDLVDVIEKAVNAEVAKESPHKGENSSTR